MSRSLAQLRADARPRVAERTYNLCLAQDLVSRVQALTDEKATLAFEIGVEQPGDDLEEKPKKPRRAADPRQARLTAIDGELESLYEEMREHSGDLVLRATTAGDWQKWVDQHPARILERDGEGHPIINPIDESVTFGLCDASALLDDLGKYVATWNGEPVSDDDFAYLVENAAPGDVKELCRIVVTMMEGAGARAPKVSSTSSSDIGTRASA